MLVKFPGPGRAGAVGSGRREVVSCEMGRLWRVLRPRAATGVEEAEEPGEALAVVLILRAAKGGVRVVAMTGGFWRLFSVCRREYWRSLRRWRARWRGTGELLIARFWEESGSEVDMGGEGFHEDESLFFKKEGGWLRCGAVAVKDRGNRVCARDFVLHDTAVQIYKCEEEPRCGVRRRS